MSFARSGPIPIGVGESDDSAYLWCDGIAGESDVNDDAAENIVNGKSSEDVDESPSGSYELAGVLS